MYAYGPGASFLLAVLFVFRGLILGFVDGNFCGK